MKFSFWASGKRRILKTFCTPARQGCFYMKKFISILMCILFCTLLIGCSSNGEGTALRENTVSSQQTKAESVSDNPTQRTAENAAEKSTEHTTVKKRASESATAKPQETPRQTEKTTVKPKKQPVKTTKPTTVTATTSSTVSCTVTIECKKILDKTDSLKAGHEAYVPDDGIMLDAYTVHMKKGETAYDAVKKACSDNGVTINAVSSTYGVYIAGFNNIDEKDCGGGSGWIYFVNGSSLSKSCAKYEIQNGDNIVFSYTC